MSDSLPLWAALLLSSVEIVALAVGVLPTTVAVRFSVPHGLTNSVGSVTTNV